MMTDEAFLEALLSFVSSIPTEDIKQVGQQGEGRRRAGLAHMLLHIAGV